MRDLIRLIEQAQAEHSELDLFFDELEQRGIKPLEELQTVSAHKKAKFVDRHDFRDYMSRLGFEHEGYGAMAEVFSHPKLNYVLKVFQLDDPYKAYIDYCKANSGNQHLPKFVGGLMRIVDENYMVRLEKLEGMDVFLYKLNIAPAIELADEIWKGFSSLDEVKQRVPRLGPTNEGIVQTLVGIMQTFGKRQGIRVDLHAGNFMRRGSTFVVTDPVIEPNASFNHPKKLSL